MTTRQRAGCNRTDVNKHRDVGKLETSFTVTAGWGWDSGRICCCTWGRGQGWLCPRCGSQSPWAWFQLFSPQPPQLLWHRGWGQPGLRSQPRFLCSQACSDWSIGWLVAVLPSALGLGLEVKLTGAEAPVFRPTLWDTSSQPSPPQRTVIDSCSRHGRFMWIPVRTALAAHYPTHPQPTCSPEPWSEIAN